MHVGEVPLMLIMMSFA